jgi:hypothetical protein
MIVGLLAACTVGAITPRWFRAKWCKLHPPLVYNSCVQQLLTFLPVQHGVFAPIVDQIVTIKQDAFAAKLGTPIEKGKDVITCKERA